jgi:hypothetical protein
MARLRSQSWCILCAVTAMTVAALTMFLIGQPTANAQDKKAVSFINDVAPIFKESCFACHDAKKRNGKLDMTTFEKLREGGANGDPIVEGKADESELYTLLVTHERRRMPPRDKGEAVAPAKAELIARWINEGAKLDPDIDPKADLIKELRVRWRPPVPPLAYKFPVIINAMTFTPDDKQLVIGGHHELTVWDIETGKLVKRIRTRAERAYALAFAPDGKLVMAGGRPGQEGDVRVFDLNAPPAQVVDGVAMLNGVDDPKVMLKQLVDTEDSMLCLAISPDGRRLAASGCDRIVRVWDISQGVVQARLEQTIENHADWVFALAFSGDGKLLASAGRDKTAKVWDLESKESILTFPDHQAPVYGVTLSADGKLGTSAGADRNLRRWNAVNQAKQVKAIGGHGDEIFRLVAHPKQPLLVTASADKTVRLWDANSGNNLKTLQGLNDHVYAAAISANGQLVAGGGYDGEVRVWNVADGKVIRAFNASPGYAGSSVQAPKQ